MGGGVRQWLLWGSKDRTGEARVGDSIPLPEGKERVESPSNTWGPLLQSQEIKEIFSKSSQGKREERPNVQ